MEINRNIKNDKSGLLSYFRNRSAEIQSELSLRYSAENFRKKASALNKAIVQSKDNLMAILLQTARIEQWTNEELLESVLMVTYANDVVMLESRNSIWEYDYMAFSRRIGELWEPFCKLCFTHPLTGIRSFVPPLFSEVKQNLTLEINNFIDGLAIGESEREQLKIYYEKVWGLVTSGEIKLECDLHFTDGVNKYIVDFKSGFGSNEKGNTNRLLLVGSIYDNIEDENYKCMIFVRSNDNNHYLSTLRTSRLWDVSCGSDTYDKILQYTGFNIRDWIDRKVDWMSDFVPQMQHTVISKELQGYLIW